MPLPELGVQIATIPACKVCSAKKRHEIEDMYVMGRRKLALPDGKVPNVKWMAENSKGLFGVELDRQNIHSHVAKHFQEGDPAVLNPLVADGVSELKDLMERGELPEVTPDDYLKLYVSLAYQKLLSNPNSVTNDGAIKAIDSLTRRKHNDVQDRLMEELVGAIGSSTQRMIQTQPMRQLEPETVTVEAEEVDDAPAV